jgi:PKD repeat protein
MEPIYFAVWIDFNRNNTFETSEIIMQNSNTIMRALPTFTDGDLWITKTFPIPAGTPTGTTRMRIARGMEPTGTTYSSTFILDPCPDAATFLMGCAYDFNVNIVAGGGTTTTTRPVAGFSASATAGTVSTIFTLTDTSRNTPTAWAWRITPNTYTFVGGTSATSRNPQIQFTAAGAYTVKLVASNAAGADSVSRPAYITVTAAATTTRPVAGFSASATAGTVSTIFTLTDTSRNTPTAWAWSITPNTYTFVGGTSATSRNPQIQFTAVGAYTVKLVASNAAGVDSVSRPAYITVTAAATTLRPISGFSASATAGTVCTIFTLTDTSRNTPTAWAWSITPNTYTFVGGTSATSRNTQIQFSAVGAYSVKLVASNAAGADSVSRPAYITVTPITTSMAGFKVDRTLGTTLTVFAFTDTSRPAATSWKWSFTPNTITYQAGTTATSQNPKIKCNAPGFYTVKLVVKNSTRTDSVTKTNFLNVATTGIEEMNTSDRFYVNELIKSINTPYRTMNEIDAEKYFIKNEMVNQLTTDKKFYVEKLIENSKKKPTKSASAKSQSPKDKFVSTPIKEGDRKSVV